jgi:hypothetical protein
VVVTVARHQARQRFALRNIVSTSTAVVLLIVCSRDSGWSVTRSGHRQA